MESPRKRNRGKSWGEHNCPRSNRLKLPSPSAQGSHLLPSQPPHTEVLRLLVILTSSVELNNRNLIPILILMQAAVLLCPPSLPLLFSIQPWRASPGGYHSMEGLICTTFCKGFHQNRGESQGHAGPGWPTAPSSHCPLVSHHSRLPVAPYALQMHPHLQPLHLMSPLPRSIFLQITPCLPTSLSLRIFKVEGLLSGKAFPNPRT